jgi:hypothetical protein
MELTAFARRMEGILSPGYQTPSLPESASLCRRRRPALTGGVICIAARKSSANRPSMTASTPAQLQRLLLLATDCCCLSSGDLIFDAALPPRDKESHTIRELRRRNAAFMVAEPLDEVSCAAILEVSELLPS